MRYLGYCLSFDLERDFDDWDLFDEDREPDFEELEPCF